MENLSHSLTGLALAKTQLGERIPFGVATLVVAANLPDLDILVSLEGPLHYLHYHRGITHSLIGTVVMGLVLGIVVFMTRRFSRVPGARFIDCLWITQLGALTHPLLDYTNSYGLRPFLPFSEARYFGDLVFIVDPYLWLILGSTTFLASRWGRWGRTFWMVGLGAVLAVTLLFLTTVPSLLVYLVILLVGLGVTIWVRLRYGVLGPGTARAGLALMVGYWLLLGGLHQLALRHAGVWAGEFAARDTSALAALPRPADPIRWDIFLESRHQLHTATIDSLNGRIENHIGIDHNRDSPEVKAALETCPGRVLAHFGRFVRYQVEETDSGRDVIFRDLRFGRGNGSGFGTYRIRLKSDLSGLRSTEPCPDPESYLPSHP